MTHYIISDRSKDRMLEIETSDKDLHFSLNVRAYSEILLALHPLETVAFVEDVESLSEIRQHWFEATDADCIKMREIGKTIPETVELALRGFAKKWNFYYGSD